MKVEVEPRPFVTVACLEEMLRSLPDLLSLPEGKALTFLRRETKRCCADSTVQIAASDLRRAKRRVLEEVHAAKLLEALAGPPSADDKEDNQP